MKKSILLVIPAFVILQSFCHAQSFLKSSPKFMYADSLMSRHALWIDAENDGDLDLFITDIFNLPNKFYQNTDNRLIFNNSYFPAQDGGNSNGSAWADVDGDQDLDCFVYNIFGQKNYLYKKNGNQLFDKIWNSPIVNTENNAFSAAFCDYDNDGDQDLFITNTELWNLQGSTKKNVLYDNDGKGNFIPDTKTNFNVPEINSRGCAWGDYDNDGLMDLFVANFGSKNFLYINKGNGTFLRTSLTNEDDDTVAAEWVDIDNDGDLDLYTVNVRQSNRLYLNNSDGSFLKSPLLNILSDKDISGSCSWGDYNNDGYMDLYGSSVDKQQNVLYANLGEGNNWLRIKLRGNGSNLFGVGARVRLKATINGKSVWQMRDVTSRSGRPQVNAFDIHFGLSKASTIEEVEILWPSGKIQKVVNLPLNRVICVEEGEDYYIIPDAKLQPGYETKLKDVSVELVADSMKMNSVQSISLFYENKSIVPVDVTIQLEVDQYLRFQNSFPAPSKNERNIFEWRFKSVKAGERGVITAAFRVPFDSTLKGEDIFTKAIIYPVAFDENKSDNTNLKVQKVIE